MGALKGLFGLSLIICDFLLSGQRQLVFSLDNTSSAVISGEHT
jgi:hypothetical protein